MKTYTTISLVVAFVLILIPALVLSSLTSLLALDNQGGPNQNVYLYTGPQVERDNYDFGNCTWWVSYLRSQINQPIPNTWGDAITWADRAKKDGYLVDKIPSVGAIMQDSYAPGGFGHVAFVESVDSSTGDWTISEMNRVGFDEVDTRVMQAASAQSYNFIHGII